MPKEKTSTKSRYQCPIRTKNYTSISGFRGHVSKIHNRGDLKAHDNQKAGEGDIPQAASFATCNLINEVTLKECLYGCIHMAVTAVMDDTIFKSEGDSMGSIATALLSSTSALTKLEAITRSPILRIFSAFGKSSSFSADRERMWADFHEYATDDILCSDLTQVIQEITPVTTEDARFFSQCFLDELVDSIYKHFCQQIEKTSESKDELSKEENETLFYICGFLITAVSKQATRRNKSEDAIEALKKLCATSQDCSPVFLEKYKDWSRKVNRGGLKMCGDNFFFMIRHMEGICRRHVNHRDLNAQSMPVSLIKDNIMQDTTVMYYWDKLVCCSEGVKLSLLESIIDIFLRLRGHAVTKFVERQAQKLKTKSPGQSATKKSKSLRRQLKEKHSNN